jgi:hypothetical protein
MALKDHGKLSVGEIVKLTEANRNTVKLHLTKLILKNEIKKVGVGKGTFYYL